MPLSDHDMQMAGDAGVKAFRNRAPLWKNPFAGYHATLAWAWEMGWNEARFVAAAEGVRR